MNTTATILKAARDLIAKPENWTQGANARTKSGDQVGIKDSDAACFCAIGAIWRVSDVDAMAEKARDFLRDELTLPKRFVSTFNDVSTHSEVLDLFSKAIAAAEASS